MPPKTPKELREQAEKQNTKKPAPGKSRTVEGLEVPNPSRGDFLANLEKASRTEE